MGYEIHITRGRSWIDSEKTPILKSEWEAVVANDPELEVSLDEYYDRQVGRRIERIHPVLWKSHKTHVPFWYWDGRIHTTHPDKAAIKKMVQIASKLKARVVGDEDEEYGSDGEQLP